jgi:hypothetical protein
MVYLAILMKINRYKQMKNNKINKKTQKSNHITIKRTFLNNLI